MTDTELTSLGRMELFRKVRELEARAEKAELDFKLLEQHMDTCVGALTRKCAAIEAERDRTLKALDGWNEMCLRLAVERDQYKALLKRTLEVYSASPAENQPPDSLFAAIYRALEGKP